jgi:hypothetical protein
VPTFERLHTAVDHQLLRGLLVQLPDDVADLVAPDLSRRTG